MRLIDLARPHLDGVHTVVEVAAGDQDLRPLLSELENVEYVTCGPDDFTSDEAPEMGAGTLVVMAVGTDGSREIPFSAAERVVQRVGPEGHGLMLFSYPGAELPYHRVLDTLTSRHCQVLHAAALDYVHLRCGIAFGRTGHLQPPRDFSGHDAASDAASDAEGGAPEPDTVALRVANEYVLADFVSRGLRAQLLDLERMAGAAAYERSEAAGLTSRNEMLSRDLDDTRRQLQRAEAALAAIERSATWEVGRLLVGAARNPRRGVRATRQLYRLWQQRGAVSNGRAAPQRRGQQAQPVAASGIGVPEWGAADGLLTAFTAPAALRAGGDGQLVIAGALTARSAATLDGDAVVHPLLPHDASLVLEHTGADLVLIEASALLPGGPWAYAADPAAADRGRLLAGLLGLARGLGKPVVLIRDVPSPQLPELGRLASRCDAVTDAGLGVQLARFNPIDLPPDRPCDPVYCGTRSPRERPGLRRLLDDLTGGDGTGPDGAPDGGPAVRLLEEGSWRNVPSVYRRHGLFVAATADQAREQLACGARVIGPLGTAGAAPGAAAIRREIEKARDRGPVGVTEIRDALRGLFRQHATPVRLAGLARLVGLPAGADADAGAARRIAVLTAPRDQDEVRRLGRAVARQQHRPSEVVVSLPPESAPTGATGTDGAAVTERAVSAALAEARASGIDVRTVRAPGLARAAVQVRSPWAVPWDAGRDYPDTYLLDLAWARECSRADAVGYSPGDAYVFSTKIEPALARPELLAEGAGGAGFSPDSWARRGLKLFAIPG